MDLDIGFIRDGAITFILLVISLTVHEWAHAWMADKLGDDTPRMQGRLTLNPMSHIDPIGTVFIPLLNIFLFRGMFSLIGWGRPVMTNPSNFRHRTRDEILVALAGPGSNIVMAVLGVFVGVLLIRIDPKFGELCGRVVLMNVGLAVFNLLPLPPLDGSYVLRHLVRMKEETFYSIARWSGLVMLVMINLDFFRRGLTILFLFACLPFAHLTDWLNEAAVPLLFPFFG